MRYMFLIYGQEIERPARSAQEQENLKSEQWAVMDDAAAQGIFHGAEPLHPSSTATVVRMQDGQPLVSDGPFAETKEQLAGYFILDCKDLDAAILWATRMRTDCQGGPGCVEIRPIAALPPR
jgi:hypothetical protein